MEANRNEFIENASKILLSKSEEYKCIIDKIEHYLNELLEDVKGITISGRSKDANNIAEKIYRKNYMMKYNDAAKFIEELPDGIGVRIICLLNQDEVKIYKHLIDRMPDERQIGNKSFRYRQDGNFFVCTENQPEKQKNNLDIYRMDCIWVENEKQVRVELQIKSLTNYFWGEIEHSLFYKNYDFTIGNSFYSGLMKNIHNELQNIDVEMASLENHMKKSEHNQISGQYMARRYYSMMDTFSWDSGNVSPNEKEFMKSHTRAGRCNDEHFIINRNYEYALYEMDSEMVDVKIKLSAKNKKYIATIANYIVMDSSFNSRLKNRPVYEKIEMIENELKNVPIDSIIPSRQSQLHYYCIKKVFFDNTKYPKNLSTLSKKKEKKDALKNYYELYFEDEFIELTNLLKRDDLVIKYAMEYELKKYGFENEDDSWTLYLDNVFSNFEIVIDEKHKKLKASVELYNPTSADNPDDKIYGMILDYTEKRFYEIIRKKTCMQSNWDYGNDQDESFYFHFDIETTISSVEKFIAATYTISEELCDEKFLK